MGFVAKARLIAWGAPPETKEERKLLVKVDFFILSFICLMYFSNYLDRANLANAYVSGMKESLGMVGDDLNKVNTMFTVGYTIAMIPQNILIQYVPPRVVFPIMTVTWGGLTMVTAAAKSTTHLMVIRFFQGMAEASTFVGAHVIMGSWYKEAELCKRAAIFSSAAQVATIFSGVLQASIYTNLDGNAGLHGFQWLFIICGVITISGALFLIGIYGFLFFPDSPQTNKSIVFNAEERAMAAARVPPPSDTKLDLSIFRRVLGRWRFWLFSLIWIVGGELESIGSNSLMALWMKNRVAAGVQSWTVQDFNYYPSGATAVSIVALLGTAIWTDWNGKRYQVNLLICVCMLLSSVLILCQDSIAVGAVFFAFYIQGASYAGQASNFSWANDACKDDEQERSIVLASMNMWSNAFNAWWSIVFFPADHAPKWERGMISIIVLIPIMVFLTSTARYLQLRDQRLGGSSPSSSAAVTVTGDEPPASTIKEGKEKDAMERMESGGKASDIEAAGRVQELPAAVAKREGGVAEV
ncbi:hypothetical protein JCM6882_000883 [Rhodosporidiobolus microsporus]